MKNGPSKAVREAKALKPGALAYAKARSLDHAVGLLAEADGDARILAGGQSLVATLNMRLQTPDILIDINGLDGLGGIVVTEDRIEIGALVRQADAERSDAVRQHAPLLAEALPHVAHAAIRNRGTIGGSIAFADPAAELPACLLALGGEVEIQGPEGSHRVHADAFFQDLYTTALGPTDILTAVRLPKATPDGRYGFAELARRHGDYAMAGLAASARATDGGLADVRLAFFGVGLTPLRARGAETALEAGSLEDAVAALASDLDPTDDVQATAAAKRRFASVLLRRVAETLRSRPS